MKLHAIYRSTGKEHAKPKPAYYSKLLCLLAFLRSREECKDVGELIFLNDGPIADDILEVMASSGEVVALSDDHAGLPPRIYAHASYGAGIARSYLGAIGLVDTRRWRDDDVVYLVEDDYLHRAEAVSCLWDAARTLPQASYIALYATIDWTRTFPVFPGGRRWHIASSTASTFAARIGALRADKWMHRISFFAAGSPDRDICLAYQGFRPFRWSYLVGDLLGNAPGAPGRPSGRLKRALLQSSMNLLAIRASFRRHLLIAPDPALATPVESAVIAPGVDWEAVANETVGWARKTGLPVPPAWSSAEPVL